MVPGHGSGIAGPGIEGSQKNSDILGGLDYMVSFAALAGIKLPEKDREDAPIIFDSYDMSPVLLGKGGSAWRMPLRSAAYRLQWERDLLVIARQHH